MAVNQEENLSSGIKFNNEGFLKRRQMTERENPKRFNDNMYFTGNSFGMGPKISFIDAAIMRCIEAFDRESCGFKTKETSESAKVDDDIKKVGSTSEEWPYEDCNNVLRFDMEDFLPFGYERKGVEKDGTRAVKDCANYTSPLPNLPLDLDVDFVWIEDFGSSEGDECWAKKNGSMLGSKDYVTVNNHYDQLGGYIKFRFDKYWFPAPLLNDPLPWRNIHIDHPFNDKITDDDLLRITNLARGTLHSLSLVECRKITATALRRIFLRNPGLYEVSVVLKGETMIVNKEGYINGDFMERQPGITRIDLNLRFSDEDTAAAAAADDASGEVYEDNADDDDDDDSQSQMQYCEDISALLPNDPFGMGVWPDDYPTDPFGVDWRKGEFVASVLYWVFN